jgi:hypothetical protein
LLLVLFVASRPATAAAGINQQLNFQGRLLNSQGATVPDGFYNIQFKIYQDGDGQSVGNTTGSPAGSLKWTETYLNNNSQGVVVKNGFLSVQLGSITAFGSSIDWNQDTLWLSMNIAGTNGTCATFAACSPDGEMVPMKRLSANAYAINSSQLGGLTSSQFLQLAQGLQTDASNSTSLAVNKTGSGNLINLQSSGADVLTVTGAGDINLGANADHTISVATAGAATAGKNLTVSAGNAGTGNLNGGSLTLSGGAGSGTGVKGLVNLGVSAFQSVTNTTCAANCSIDQTNVDSYSTVVVNASTAGILMTLPDPTNTAINGRIIYITVANGSSDFTLESNSGASVIDIAMRQNATATMVWNGTDWTAAGASNATTLQATYNNGTNPSTTPEIKLDSTHGTIDIQDADTTLGVDLFNIRASNTGNLGTVLLGVGNTGTVTIRNSVDQQAAFRFQNAAGNYILNVNTQNGYFINNGIRDLSNDLSNPGFEAGPDAGGNTSFGEQGWFGSAQSTIVTSSANAHSGNNELQVTPNGTDLDIYGGQYYEVQPGDTIYLEGWVKNSAGANGTGGIQLTFLDKDKTNPTYSTDYGTLPGTTYIRKTVTATVPAGKYYVRASAAVRSAATTGTYYFDDFLLRRANTKAPAIFVNNVDSTTAFRIQSASAAQTLFTADTTNNVLKVGDSTGTDTATTILVLDSTTANPTTGLASRNGGLFYRSDTGSLKTIISGAVYDVCTTAVTCSGYSASASSSVQLQTLGGEPGIQQAGFINISGVAYATGLLTQNAASGNTSSLNIKTGNATSGNSGSITLDVGTASGTLGTITIGHTGVATTMPGTLDVQGSGALKLGTASSASGSILFRNSAGANTITLQAPGANPTSNYTLTLPQNLGSSGDCLKDSGSGALSFGNCATGVTTNLQDVYNNSSSPATITLANGKNLVFNAQDTTTDPNVIVNLQCTASCSTDGRFAVQNGGSDVLTVSPNGGGITLNGKVQIGSSTTDTTENDLILDRSSSTSENTCNSTTNLGAMYYNTTMGSIRACINGNWNDLSNPDTLGLLSFGIVPSSGSNPYDLTGAATAAVSGPCKPYWSSNTVVAWQGCVAYSQNQRITVSAGSATVAAVTSQWQHLCLTGTNGAPALSTASATYATGLPSFTNISSPTLCLADIRLSTTSGRIGAIYDTRTFTSTIKEAVPASTAVELGMIVDSNGTNGAMVPAASGSGKLYGVVVATDGGTSSTDPNVIVTTVGSGWMKAIAGTAGDFTKTSTTAGYANTIASIPNNSFYYSAGNTRTNFTAPSATGATACSSVTACSGSLYANIIVR